MQPCLETDCDPAALALLRRIAGDGKRSAAIRKRARIALLAAESRPEREIAKILGVSRPTVSRWRKRFEDEGVEGLLREKAGKPGRKSRQSELSAEVLALICQPPPQNRTVWTGRAMAEAMDLSLRSVQRIWSAENLDPRRIRFFRRPRDHKFAASVANFAGFYGSERLRAVILRAPRAERPVARPEGGKSPRAPITPVWCFHEILCDLDEAAASARPIAAYDGFCALLAKIDAATPVGDVFHVIVHGPPAGAAPLSWLSAYPRLILHIVPEQTPWLTVMLDFFATLLRCMPECEAVDLLATFLELRLAAVAQRDGVGGALAWTR